MMPLPQFSVQRVFKRAEPIFKSKQKTPLGHFKYSRGAFFLGLYQASSLFFLIITPAAAAAVITANDDNAIPRFALPVLGILDETLFSPPESLASARSSIFSEVFFVVSAGAVSVTGAGSFSPIISFAASFMNG